MAEDDNEEANVTNSSAWVSENAIAEIDLMQQNLSQLGSFHSDASRNNVDEN